MRGWNNAAWDTRGLRASLVLSVYRTPRPALRVQCRHPAGQTRSAAPPARSAASTTRAPAAVRSAATASSASVARTSTAERQPRHRNARGDFASRCHRGRSPLPPSPWLRRSKSEAEPASSAGARGVPLRSRRWLGRGLRARRDQTRARRIAGRRGWRQHSGRRGRCGELRHGHEPARVRELDTNVLQRAAVQRRLRALQRGETPGLLLRVAEGWLPCATPLLHDDSLRVGRLLQLARGGMSASRSKS